jgi:hypothetical protein
VPLQAEIEAVDHELDRRAPEGLAQPGALLDAEVDDERLLAPEPAWDASRLEYRVALAGVAPPAPGQAPAPVPGGPVVTACEHDGGVLDWYAFTLDPGAEAAWPAPRTVTKIPAHVTFRGMPKTRFWDLEDERVNFAALGDPDNFLSVMLQEFGLLYANDWFLVPIEQEVNTLRRIDRVVVRDVFGEEVQPPPVATDDPFAFQQFAMTLAKTPGVASSRYFLLPDALGAFHASEPLEQVVFFRDELSNVVWGVEQISRGGTVAEPPPRANAAEDRPRAEPSADPRPRVYRPLQLPPRNHIPFVPVRISSNGQMQLRRARTVSDPFDIQHRTVLVRDTVTLHEEEIPGQPISVTQTARLACRAAPRDAGSDEPVLYYLWIGRAKTAAARVEGGRLRFDQLEAP